jgi:hypothetical protein
MNKNHNISLETKTEIRNLINTTLEQKYKYIEHNRKWYKQNDGLAMGAPASAILAEVFIQYLEHTTIFDILKKFQIVDYYKYVDILIIYNTRITNIDNTLNEFNNIHHKIKFTMEKRNK